MKIRQIESGLQALMSSSEDTRNFVADQLHPSVKMLIGLCSRLQSHGVPDALGQRLALEVACLKVRGTSGMQEMYEDKGGLLRANHC